MVGHQMPFLDPAFLLRGKRPEDFSQVPAQLPVQRLAAAFWDENDVIFALPFRVA
jgi:hypothetical protein